MAKVAFYEFVKMPSSRHYYAIWVLTLLIPLYTASAQDRGHFVLDPGHGGKDPGSQRDGMNEKDLTLDLAKRIRKVLAGRGHSVTLTREKDIYVGLEERAAVANRIPGCIFVSLHFNSHANRSVSGIETFYWPGSIEGQRLASYVQGELGRRIVTRNRGCKPEQLKVLEATQGPAVLVECGFISNRWEFQRCCSSWFKQVLAEEIAQALIRYQKLPKNQTPGKPAIIAIPVSTARSSGAAPVSSDL